MAEAKFTTICNPSSSYVNQKVKILKYHPNEEVDVFLVDEEMLLTLSINDLTPFEDTFKPQSRKDFYEFIQRHETSRPQMMATLKHLIDQKLIELSQPHAETTLFDLFSFSEKEEIVEQIRELRDQEIIAINLANNSHSQPAARGKNNKYRNSRF